jgi:hypothetical protein
MTTENIAYGSYTALTVTNLQSLANDSTNPFDAWQSDIVDNRTTKAIDYEVLIKLSTAATAPANDATAYVYLVPWMHDGTSWVPMGNFGTTTRPTGAEGAASVSDPNSMRPTASLPYKITSQPLDGYLTVAANCGGIVPDGWSLAIRNCTGAAFGTGCVVAFKAITATNA